MIEADQVTFGGSGLDRAAELRGDAGAIGRLLAGAETRVIPFWRGKPAVRAADGALVAVAATHPVLAEASDPPVFLGQDEAGAWFGADVSAWEPATEADTLGAFFDPSEQQHPAMAPGVAFVELRGVMTRLSPRAAELAATAKAVLGWHVTHRFCSTCGQPSDIADAGWTRLCPACGTRHFPRTDPVVIMLVVKGNRLLVGRSPHWPERMYSLLAGFVEPGETFESAVRREVFEETAIRVGRVRYLACQPWPFPSSLMLGCLGEAETEEITLDPAELADAIWIGREETAQVLRGDHRDIGPPREGAIARFLIEAWLRDRLE
ncbi:MAG: NAD(+) diphosphatase [Paracoccaceae bacterium]|nr:NAD(+) diphosphatase [Paracoccaceae bacterium]